MFRELLPVNRIEVVVVKVRSAETLQDMEQKLVCTLNQPVDPRCVCRDDMVFRRPLRTEVADIVVVEVFTSV